MAQDQTHFTVNPELCAAGMCWNPICPCQTQPDTEADLPPGWTDMNPDEVFAPTDNL